MNRNTDNPVPGKAANEQRHAETLWRAPQKNLIKLKRELCDFYELKPAPFFEWCADIMSASFSEKNIADLRFKSRTFQNAATPGGKGVSWRTFRNLANLVADFLELNMTYEEMAEGVSAIPMGLRTKRATYVRQPAGKATSQVMAAEVSNEDMRESFRPDIPHRHNPYFTGRTSQLEILRAQTTAQQDGTVAISGLGGIGKTQLAVEYAYRFGHTHSHLLWSAADNHRSLADGYYAIAKKLQLPVNYAEPMDAVKEVHSWMNDHTGWLLILDNADHPEILEPYVPRSGPGHVFITSRGATFDHLGHVAMVPVDEFTVSESVEFLAARTRRTRLDADERSAASEIGETLHGLALALEQAAAYISETKMSFSKYARQLKSKKASLLDLAPPVVGNYPATVATTWKMNFEEVQAQSKASIEFLGFLSFLGSPEDDSSLPFHYQYILKATDAIDPELMPDFYRQMRDADDPEFTLATILAPLARFSFIRITEAADAFTVHPLVVEIGRAFHDA